MRKEKLKELKSYINELKVIKEEKINQVPKFLSIEKSYYTLKNGRIIPKERILKNGHDGSAAIILPLTRDNNALLVVQPRPNTKDGVLVELPAGYIEFGENPIDAAKRELKEETGYISKEWKLLTNYYQDQGCYSAYNYGFLALNCCKRYEQKLDKDEIIKYFECSYDEVIELMEMGYIKDVNSKYLIEVSKKYMK